MEDDRVCQTMEMLRSGMNRLEDEWKLGETRMLEAFRLEKHRLSQIVTGTFTEVERVLKDPSLTPDLKNMELCFLNKISQPILTGGEIKGDGDDFIQVVLRDSSTRNIVDIGPIAFASVEIVVLGQGTDDWTGEEFNQKIVRVEGKPPLLTVHVCKLQRGIGVLENVKFRYHAIDVKPSVFRLGARIAEKFDGIIVKEAKTESFAIKSYRSKYTRKNEIPNLSDKIWVLMYIQRRGNIYMRLQDEGIDSVEKFLIQLLINPHKLRNITGLGRKKWEATLNHAQKCESNKVYWYTSSQGNPGVVFDIFGKLQGLYSEGQFFAATNMLSENKKVDADKLLLSAFEHWEDVTPYVDLESLQQHLAAMKTSFNPSNPCFPGQHYAAELVKPSEFWLGARTAEKFDGITVKEATTASFVFTSYRNEYSQKNEIPCLEDNIWVLKNIQRRGNIEKRMQDKGIDTVEKFLIQLLINPEELKNIFGLGGEKWKATVNHARKCESNRMYCYTSSQETCVVFDIFGRLQGLHSEGYYIDANMLSKNKKVDAEKLLLSAFEHWEDVTSYVDLESLQQHLAAARTSFQPSNSCIPGHPDTNPAPELLK